jgi:hypothetical protein
METSEGESLGTRPFGDAQETSLLASCFWCEATHAASHPLSVCPGCIGTYRARSYPMGPLEMTGSFPLDDEMIDSVMDRTSPGNYALGYMEDAMFQVFYVGRSDSDVRRRLHEWVGAPSRYARYAPLAKAAWDTRQRGPLPLQAPACGRVATGVESSYTRFAYSYASSAEAAFEKECRNYDDFGGSAGLDNEAHPDPAPHRESFVLNG